jgi:antagonist of KipI
MDPLALRVANALVGNPDCAAALEFTLTGPELEFSEDTVVAIGGAECDGLPSWKPVPVRRGQTLRLGACTHGCRGYLAVAGGIDAPLVLGSRSTYLRAGFGGMDGRALRDGDVLKVGASRIHPPTTGTNWRIDPRILPAYSTAPNVRVIAGAQAGEFGEALCATAFALSPQSDRMGLRLTGPALTRSNSDELLSSAVAPGTIQIPPDGHPVVLMADAQTIGGYPQAAHAIAVDLPLLAQLRPGDSVRFIQVTLAEAHRLDLTREKELGILREGLAQKLGLRAT